MIATVADEPVVYLGETWSQRRARILADPGLDDRLKALYLDDTEVSAAGVAEIFGWAGPGRVHVLNTDKDVPDGPHPKRLPTAHTSAGKSWSHENWRWYRGVITEWGIHTKKLRWNAETGKLERGRPRHGKVAGTRIRMEVFGRLPADQQAAIRQRVLDVVGRPWDGVEERIVVAEAAKEAKVTVQLARALIRQAEAA